MQECAYKGFFYIHKLKNPNIFKTWITRVLINVAIDYLKKESKIIYLDNDSSIACDEKDISLEEKMQIYKKLKITDVKGIEQLEQLELLQLV